MLNNLNYCSFNIFLELRIQYSLVNISLYLQRLSFHFISIPIAIVLFDFAFLYMSHKQVVINGNLYYRDKQLLTLTSFHYLWVKCNLMSTILYYWEKERYDSNKKLKLYSFKYKKIVYIYSFNTTNFITI